ncbi:MAG: AraC family transcriptional regulator [Ruminococcaceae bacterium]|nr:AraC family transcriptional regulator [Oscillospiraceae bacterium]
MIYQFQNSLRGKGVMITRGTNVSYPPHLHNSFEFVAVTDGEMSIFVERKCYSLKKGDSLLIFPNQVHEFKTHNYSADFVCIFSAELVDTYASLSNGKIPVSNVLISDRNYAEEISRADQKNIMSMQGVLYSLCGEFHEKTQYTEKKDKSASLIESIFKFVEDNYQGDCSLKSLSQHTSYNYVYLSKYFKQYTAMTFIEYVNGYRANEACIKLQNPELTILGVAYDCGFGSLRNFNRIFKKTVGITPCGYRAKLKEYIKSDP